ncbi:fasciclin domain-containing protein [Terrimonas ferruginea]|uniref:fasciclin domain-containing protein n=1 Tax=Terrimonas ferruginea TaxID=249 RepID=UPI00048E19C2|nr:fasciclin domain-containing protein [Terrimonas ferruginea]
MTKNLRLLAPGMMALLMVACNNEADNTVKTDDTATKNTQMEPAPMPEEKGVMVGGANMVPSKDIVDNAMNSADHTTLVAAVKAAGLVETLKGAGPFTVFAPTNEAFGKLPAGTVDNLLKPENKAKLSNVLTYHVVPGSYKSTDLKDGQKLKTVQGEELTIWYKDGKWAVSDAKGGKANITIADVISSNGVTYVIDGVMMPKK